MSQQVLHSHVKLVKQRFGLGEPCENHFFVNDWLFIIRLSRDTGPSNSIQDTFLRRIDTAEEKEDYEELSSILEEVEKLINTIYHPRLSVLPPRRQNLRRTLEYLLFPPTKVLELVTVDGAAMLTPVDTRPAPDYPNLVVNLHASPLIPTFRPSEITVLEELYSTRVTRVSADGQEYCCKVAEAYRPDLKRELEIMQKMAETRRNLMPRVPVLRGFVRSEEGEGLIGFLMDHIRTDSNIHHLGQLVGNVNRIDFTRRMKWAIQVEENLKLLHDMGIFWGDAKPENILLDVEDDIWLIDLGGGRTEGWVSEKLQDSFEGDLEGLQLIREYLEL